MFLPGEAFLWEGCCLYVGVRVRALNPSLRLFPTPLSRSIPVQDNHAPPPSTCMIIARAILSSRSGRRLDRRQPEESRGVEDASLTRLHEIRPV